MCWLLVTVFFISSLMPLFGTSGDAHGVSRFGFNGMSGICSSLSIIQGRYALASPINPFGAGGVSRVGVVGVEVGVPKARLLIISETVGEVRRGGNGLVQLISLMSRVMVALGRYSSLFSVCFFA